MCGIAGIVRVSPNGAIPPPHEAIPESWLDILDGGIKHRGPDGHGRFRDRATKSQGQIVDIAFVHRRLSIIDHADGGQPMVAPDGSAIVFNGCIYNYREMRRDLARLGRAFSTSHSDTESLLHGWLEWGDQLFLHVDGMFAAAWWDHSAARVVIARDPFGEKPLYWAELSRAEGSCIRAFASTVTALVQLCRTVIGDCPLDSDGVASWIKFGWDQNLPYKNIHSLPPGTLAYFAETQCHPQEFANHATIIDLQPQQHLTSDRLDQLLRDSVHSRLESDVPMGFYLSGGIDSALVCKYASERLPDLTAYTVQMPDLAFDESAAARQTAAFLRISHMTLPCHANPGEDLISLINQLGLPFGDSSLLPSTWVSRAAREHATVAFGGDGGDDLFMGYDRHRIIKPLWLLMHLPRPLLRTLASCIAIGPDAKSSRTRLARLLSAAASGGYRDLLAIFPAGLCAQLGLPPRHSDLISASFRDSQAQARRIDALNYLPDDLLRKSDTASMYVALELRAPFLARDIARAALSANIETLMPRGERKGLLKSVARRYLPDSIVDRPKQGFAIPIGTWFRTDFGGMKTLLLDTLNSADPFPTSQLGFTINRTAINRMVAEHMDGVRDHSQRLYMLMVLGIWTRS